MRIEAVGRALPTHHVQQPEVSRLLGDVWSARGRSREAVARLLGATGVETRHLTFPLAAYVEPRSFGQSNDTFIEASTQLAAAAARDGLTRAGLAPTDVDLLVLVTTTGVAVPSIDARLVNLMQLRRDIHRLPVVGLGCVGGATGIARCADYVRGRPGAVALLVCVELCSLTFQLDDTSIPNLVASGLFGDAAASAVISGRNGAASRGPRIVDARSIFHPDTERVLGLDVVDSGFRVVLSSDLPDVATRGLCADVDALLAPHGLGRPDVGVWIVHPGGPKVLQSVERTLDLAPGALDASRAILRDIGNVSSATVLCILRAVLDAPPPRGTYGVLLGMGPGFSAEAVLLQW